MYEDLIKRTNEVLQQPIPLTDFRPALEGCMKLTAPILTARVASQVELYNKRAQARHPKDKELTDFDRNIMLEGMVSEYTSIYETLRGLEVLLAERIDVLKKLLT